MSTLNEIRGVKVRVRTGTLQPRNYHDECKPVVLGVSKSGFHFPQCGPRQISEVHELLRENSVVYAKKGQHLPKVSQKTPRLRAALLKGYTFHCPGTSTSLPLISTIPAPDKQTASITRKQNKNFPETRATFHQQFKRSKTFHPLPSDQILLRRPTFVSSLPVASRDIEILSKSMILKPFNIDDSFIKTWSFYQSHYPLLLERKFEGEKEKIIKRRCSTPLDNAALLQKRANELNRKTTSFDRLLDELEKEMENEVFVTELRAETFDPRQWPWNESRYC